MTPKKDVEDQLDQFLESEQFYKIKNIAGNLVKLSVDKLDNFVEGMKEKRQEKLPVIKNESIVTNNKKDLAYYKFLSTIFTIFIWLNVFIALLTLAGFLISQEIEALKVVLFFFLPVIGLFYFGNTYSKKKSKQLIRYKKYLNAFGNASVATLENLAISANTDKDTALKDLQHFINNNYLKEARLVENNQILILDNKSYVDYKNYLKNSDLNEASDKDSNYITKLIYYKQNLKSPMKDYANELLEIISKFKSNVDKELNKSSYEKFRSYYIPETINLFDQYSKIENFKIKTNDEIEVKKEIEASLKDIISGLKKLLEATFEMNYINIKSDISVLKSMLKNDGYIDEDFN